jgi:hypothetical protein
MIAGLAPSKQHDGQPWVKSGHDDRKGADTSFYSLSVIAGLDPAIH